VLAIGNGNQVARDVTRASGKFYEELIPIILTWMKEQLGNGR
jgi:hypothetical protein